MLFSPAKHIGRLLRTVCLPVFICTALSACQNMPTLPGLSAATTPAIDPVKPLPPAADPVRQWPDQQKDVLMQRARFYGLVNMPEMEAYLNQLLNRIKQTAAHPEWPGKVYILATPSLDAYATAAGNIYISQAWLQNIASEDEIVALLSHEFGHIYLHYHQLDGAVITSDQIARHSGTAYDVVKNLTKNTDWVELDTLMTSYALGRDWITSAWGRAQESAADSFGLNISMQLGYSYEAGFKTLLERLSAWEAQQAITETKRRQALVDEITRKAVEDSLAKTTPAGTRPNIVSTTSADIIGGVTRHSQQLFDGIGDLFKSSTKQHPDTLARISALVDKIEPYEDQLLGRATIDAPWNKAIKQPGTAATLKNYRSAIAALSDLNAPGALAQAQQAIKRPTANHALPLLAYYRASIIPRKSGPRPARDPGAILMNNIRAKDDRAWQTYVERATTLKAQGQGGNAQKLMQEGLAFFNNSIDVWVQSIAFTGGIQGWTAAKDMANDCARTFTAQAATCLQAAVAPAEQQRIKDSNTQKGEQRISELLNNLFK